MKSGCFLSCKDTNSKANHNHSCPYRKLKTDVSYLAKILILKQITTRRTICMGGYRCFLSCKDTNSKANHNYQAIVYLSATDVSYLAKILILKQITTDGLKKHYEYGCFLSCKDTNSKANHNRFRPRPRLPAMFPILQRY